MTEQKRRADDKRAPGPLHWGDAKPTMLVPKWAGEFSSYQHWVNKAQTWLRSPGYRPAICVDAKGRRCAIGADFMLARDEGAFPVRYFWECEVAAPASADNPSTAGGELETLRQENDKLREALGDSALAATMLHKLSVENGGINAVYSGGAAQILAEALGQQFIESGAENYLEVGFNTNTGVRLLVTLQRCDGKTPANFRAEAEEKLTAATADLEESRSRVKQLEEMLENRVERKPDSTQEWAKVDGAIAFHLIERHADNWHDAGNMMESWRAANTLAAPVAQSTAGAAIGFISRIELAKLQGPDLPADEHVRLWHAENPPSRAVVPVYLAAPVAQSTAGAANGGITSLEGLTRYGVGGDGELQEMVCGDAYLVADVEALLADPAAQAPTPTAAEVRDKMLLDSMDAWIERNKKNGHHHFVFAFDTDSSAREQIAADDILQSALGEKGGE